MKTFRTWIPVFALSVVCTLLCGAAPLADDPTTEQKAAITKTAEAFVAAFAKGDANAVAAFWTEDGDYIDLDGLHLKGRKAIAGSFTELFAGNKGLTVRIEVRSIRFPTSDTAVEEGVTSVLGPDNALPNRAHYTNFMVKKDGRWLLSSVVETPYVPPNNTDALRPLDWVIGDWAEDVKDPQLVHVGRVVFNYSPDLNFIVGARAVQVKDVILDNGSQRIGWDPAAKIFRCWSFESDGGFGEGVWKQDGNKWLITMSAVLRSGSLMTHTTVITRVNADTITWQTKDQKLDGKALPDSPVTTMKRVK